MAAADAGRSRAESFADVAVKPTPEEMEKELQQREELYAQLEKELKSSEERIEKAEARYKEAWDRISKELGKEMPPLNLEPAEGDLLHEKEVEEKALTAADEVKADLPEKGHKKDAGHDHYMGKNAKVVPDKVLSCQKWLQKRSTEHRTREAERRARDKQRRGARDRKMESAELPAEGGGAAAAVPAARERAGSGDSLAGRSRAGSGDSIVPEASKEEAAKGAKSIANRVKVLSERPNAADKRASLLKVLTCGRPDFYCFNAVDVLDDLKNREELPEALVTELLNILADESVELAAEPLPASEWLAHAKKMSQFKRLDDAPFTDMEALYLGYLDGRYLKGAEAELEAAEAQLEEAVIAATEAYYGQAILEAEAPAAAQAKKEVDIDEDKVAEQVQLGKERDHKGAKNTKVLPQKVVSCQKWLADRGRENRARDAQKKARDLLRSSQRDGKRTGGYAAA
eukprot:gb/GFBE01033041.1/.p1 GENE.gb/GFBE01033041.1/~~gb/GFBE01033041.1/.p1  ORF type:complete len:458 (+),score=154.61 gb/GFBE01033041.1/:1-1374(+)